MKYFFIGIAGSGMSALAQFLAQKGNVVCGSDRLFCNEPNHFIFQKLRKLDIELFEQGKSLLSKDFDFVIVSTAIEENVYEYKKAKELGLKIIHRSELLQHISRQYNTIAVAGTSGKSTTTAMIYTILDYCGLEPSVINGSGLKSLQKEGLIGNCKVGNSNWLVIEADESDGTLVKYEPHTGIILNIERDHKEFDELLQIFGTFASNSKNLIVNLANNKSALFSKKNEFDFGTTNSNFSATNISTNFDGITFELKNQKFEIPILGVHNIENATAAIAVAQSIGIELESISKALKNFQGIDRRMQIVGKIANTVVIDDFAHNPAKIKSAIESCQMLSNKVIAFFQPHGFAPLFFFKDELVEVLSKTLRITDEIHFSEVFFAGGTVNKTISSADVVAILQKKGFSAFYYEDRNQFVEKIYLSEEPTIVLVMGARDPSLGDFAEKLFINLKNRIANEL